MIEGIFDQILENFQDTAEKCKGEDEINSWTTDDNFNEIRKASYLLQKGFEQQKYFVISNLSSLYKENDANSVLTPILLRSVGKWPDMMKNEFAEEVVKIMHHFDSDQLEDLMHMTFEMIEFFNSESWVQVYNKLVALMDKSYIDEHFEEFSLEHAEFSS